MEFQINNNNIFYACENLRYYDSFNLSIVVYLYCSINFTFSIKFKTYFTLYHKLLNYEYAQYSVKQSLKYIIWKHLGNENMSTIMED